MSDSDRYTMRISRLTIDKLGIKLYDKVSAVLAELLANAYDADARKVTITLPIDKYLAHKKAGQVIDDGFEIHIEDDGHGMTPEEVNEHYLIVGADRRKRPQGDKSLSLARPVMGRKGIGKLAPFGICKEIEIISAGGEENADDYEIAHLILRYEDITSVEDDVPSQEPESDLNYHPRQGALDGTRRPNRGTSVILRDFDRRRVPDKETLFRQLTARFGLEREDWRVEVKDSTQESGGFELSGRELEVAVMEGTLIHLDDRPVTMEDGTNLNVKGWVGYAKDPYKDEVMAGVRIYARGKIVSKTRDFDVSAGFTGEYKMRSYLTGYIEADWLDDSEEDLIRSDRQDIIWNSDKGEAFREWGRQLIKELAGSAETSVKARAWDEFLNRSDLANKAIAAFPNDPEIQKSVERAARMVLKGSDGDAIHSDPDWVNRIVDFSLSVAPHAMLLEALHDTSSQPDITLDAIVDLFGKIRIAELCSLAQVAQERIDAVEELKDLVKTATTERPLQKLLERAPWLLAPQWTPILMDRSLEVFRTTFEEWYEREYGVKVVTTTIDNPTKEPDFIFVSFQSCLYIVEIKKPKHALKDEEFGRAHKYLAAVRKYLRSDQEFKGSFPKGVKLILVADKLALGDINLDLLGNSKVISRRTWHAVLQKTLKVHADFLKARKGTKTDLDVEPSQADTSMASKQDQQAVNNVKNTVH